MIPEWVGQMIVRGIIYWLILHIALSLLLFVFLSKLIGLMYFFGFWWLSWILMGNLNKLFRRRP